MKIINADWPAPKHIKAFTTTRLGGVSQQEYASLNLAQHVGDDKEAVEKNRALLQAEHHLPSPLYWLNQTHSTTIVDFGQQQHTGDACYSDQANQVCIVMTADCLPLLLCDKQGQEIAAIHAGWRGFANGVIANSIKRFNASPDQLLVWLGPCIGKQAFEVGDDVLSAFTSLSAGAKPYFTDKENGKYFFDMAAFAKYYLSTLGVENIYGGDYCTYSNEELFFSYRRDHTTGRMASLIWRED